MDKLRAFLKKVNIRALLLRAAVIAACAGIALLLVDLAFLRAAPELLHLLRTGDDYAIAAYLGSQNSVAGIISTAILSFLQPVSIVLPGAPIQIAAGVVYGTLKGFLVCHISYVLSNLVVFYVARVLRKKESSYLARFASKMSLLQEARYPVYMTAMACLMPLIPNGIIPYAAARTNMRFYQFALAVTIGSFTPILVMCAIGKRILHGDYLYAGVLFAATFAVVMLLTWLREPICGLLDRAGAHIINLLRRADSTRDE